MSASTEGRTPTRFLNVDLDLESGESLSPLLVALEAVAFDLHEESTPTGFRATLELNGVGPFDADSGILEFAAAILALPQGPRAIWDHATARVFDIGIAAGSEKASFHAALPSSTLQMVASLGASIRITVYPWRNGQIERG